MGSQFVRRHQKDKQQPSTMGGKGRQFTPRARPLRHLHESRTSNSAPSIAIAQPTRSEFGYSIDHQLAQRLYQKSGIGHQIEGQFLIDNIELIFCNWYRHVPLPVDFDFAKDISMHPTLPYEIVLFDVLRNGGNILRRTAQQHPDHVQVLHGSWGLYWNRSLNWRKDQPTAYVMWRHSSESIDYDFLVTWINQCKKRDAEAVLAVIDDELDVTTYSLQLSQLSGEHQAPHTLSDDQQTYIRDSVQRMVSTSKGWYLEQQNQQWPLPSFGIVQLSGRIFSQEEYEFMCDVNKNKKSKRQSLFAHLKNSGLLLRPGFKFGCCWRAYSGEIEEEHAPFLIPDIDVLPSNYESLCLSIRLSEGVNKRWILPYSSEQDSWEFYAIQRWNSS